MRVSRSGYYAWRKRGKSLRQKERDRLIPIVREMHRMSKGTYGTRRIAVELEDRGEPCGRTKAGTLMRLANVSVKQSKKFKATTDSMRIPGQTVHRFRRKLSTHSDPNCPLIPTQIVHRFRCKLTTFWLAAGMGCRFCVDSDAALESLV